MLVSAPPPSEGAGGRKKIKKMKKVVLAYSGGLDTSYCLKYLKNEKGFEVHTVLVDTGGFTTEELESITTRAYELGSAKHTNLTIVDKYYDKAIKAMLVSETPLTSVWLVLQTWTLSVETLNGDHLKFWQNACSSLGLLGDGFLEHVQGLDQFLDEIEIMFEEIASANGLNDEQTF